MYNQRRVKPKLMSIVDHDLQGHLNDGFAVYKMYLAIRQHFNPDNKYAYTSVRNKSSANQSLVKCSKESYEKRSNVIYFTKISKMFHANPRKIEDYIVANILKNPKWGGSHLTDDESVSTYKEWLRRVESLSYLFETDNKHLRNRCIAEYQREDGAEYDGHGRVRSRSENVEGRASIVSSNETMRINSENCSQSSEQLNSVYFNLCVLSNTGTHPLIVRELLGSRISVETLTIFMALSGCDSDWDHTDPSIANAVPRLRAYDSLLNWDRDRCMAIMRKVWHPPHQ